MGKAASLMDLYRRSVYILTKGRAEWMGLLASASKYYKLSFDKNVLIYVQRPDAGLLATKAGWEKQTGRRLKAGSRGIGVVDMDSPNATLAFYFDFSDTRGDDASFRKAMGFTWELEKQYQPEVRRRFHERFGTDAESMENCLCQLAKLHTGALFEAHPADVGAADEESMLHGLPEEAVKEEFIQLAADSAAYIIFKKCGVPADIFEEGQAFENISHFGSLKLFMELGSYAMAAAKPVLTEIRRQIEEIKEERSIAYGQGAVSETGIQGGGGRDAVSGSPDIGGQRIRREAAPGIRQEMEGLYEGIPSPEAVRAGGRGQDQRDDLQGGRGSGGKERESNPEPPSNPADAGDGGHTGEGGLHGDDKPAGGGNHTARGGIPASVVPENEKEHSGEKKEEPPAENAAGGFSFTIRESATKENVREHADWNSIRSLLTDTEVYPEELYAAVREAFHDSTDVRERQDAVRGIYRDYGFRKSGDGKRTWTRT